MSNPSEPWLESMASWPRGWNGNDQWVASVLTGINGTRLFVRWRDGWGYSPRTQFWMSGEEH